MKFYRKLLLTVLGAILANFSAYAGTISSGGGLIFGNDVNPWFLENASGVRYCIDLDRANFGTDANKIRQVVTAVIADWKDIFANNAWTRIYSPEELMPFGNIHLATQTFTEEACDDNTDLRFQFGTLSQEQIDTYGIKPQSTIAVTVRTNYDEAKLRGKGFIYVGPHTGALRFESPATVQDPWSRCDGCLLKMTLLHELGHVFGLSHFGDSSSLMGEQFIDSLTQKRLVESIESEHAWPDMGRFFERIKKIFSAENNYEVIRCDSPLKHEDDMVKFFNADKNTRCIKAQVRNRDQLVVSAADSANGPYRELGRTSNGEGSYHSSTSSLIRIRLTPEQRVFSKFPEEDVKLLGPAQQERIERRNAEFHLHDGSVKFLSFTMKPGNGLDIVGAVNGRIFAYDATP